MKKYNFFLTLTMLIILQSNMFSQQKKAVFIHGFMADASTTWTNLQELRSGYKNIPQNWANEGIIDDYSTPQLPSFVEPTTYNAIIQNCVANLDGDNNSKLLLIGHSMGGLVARDVEDEIRNNHNLKGIITLGTPHQGATIATKLNSITPTFDEVRTKMLDGPDWQSTWGWAGIILNLGSPWDLFFSLGSTIGYGIIENAFNWAEEEIKTRIETATNNNALLLAPYSGFISSINSNQAVVPHLAVGGIENSNSLIRLFGAANENSLIDDYNEVVSVVRFVRNYHKSYDHWYLEINPVTYPIWLLHHEGRIYWDHSLDAVQNIDKTWGSLHNTVLTETRTVSYRVWISCADDFDFDGNISINDLEALFEMYDPCNNGVAGYYETITNTYTVTYTDKSDGFIPLSKTKWNRNDEIINDPALENVSQLQQASISFDGAGEQEGGYNHMEVRYPVRSYGSKSETNMARFTKRWAEWWLMR